MRFQEPCKCSEMWQPEQWQVVYSVSVIYLKKLYVTAVQASDGKPTAANGNRDSHLLALVVEHDYSRLKTCFVQTGRTGQNTNLRFLIYLVLKCSVEFIYIDFLNRIRERRFAWIHNSSGVRSTIKRHSWPNAYQRRLCCFAWGCLCTNHACWVIRRE